MDPCPVWGDLDSTSLHSLILTWAHHIVPFRGCRGKRNRLNEGSLRALSSLFHSFCCVLDCCMNFVKRASWQLTCGLHSLLRLLCSLAPFSTPTPVLSLPFGHQFYFICSPLFKNVCISLGTWLEHLCEPRNCEIVEVLFPPVFIRAEHLNQGFGIPTASILDSNQPAALLASFSPSSFLFLTFFSHPLFLFHLVIHSFFDFRCVHNSFICKFPVWYCCFLRLTWIPLPHSASKAGLFLTPISPVSASSSIVPGLQERDQFSQAVNATVSLLWSPAVAYLICQFSGNECVFKLDLPYLW